jgi:Pyruvate/2-oxoacid:ferredoxin oxidoreductase delta subunit
MSVVRLTGPALRVVLYEGGGSRPISDADRFAMLSTLLQGGYAVTSVRGGSRPAPEGVVSPLVILGRFETQPPGEAESASAGAPVFFRDIDGVEPAAVAGVVESVHGAAGTGRPGGWKPWFPVIDFGRCTNCMQCLTFCLFDVYGVSPEKKIRVQNPSNCKTDCPACSRVCPEVAILFPKYKLGPINGDEVRVEDIHREKMKVDISALLGGDIYAALRQRSRDSKERFSRERDEKRALEERRKCLNKLQEQLDIPPELLAALPTLDQIREKTERVASAAASRAEAPAPGAAGAEER